MKVYVAGVLEGLADRLTVAGYSLAEVRGDGRALAESRQDGVEDAEALILIPDDDLETWVEFGIAVTLCIPVIQIGPGVCLFCSLVGVYEVGGVDEALTLLSQIRDARGPVQEILT